MKRLVLAGTAFASLSGGVQAQSSVTLFGVVDLNVRYVRNDAATWQLGQDGMAGSRLPIVVSHGEGRVEFAASSAQKQAVVALRYIDNHGRVAATYPFNPNGSPDGIAGLTTADGRFTIMMPHPERIYRTVQMSWHPDSWGEDGPWLRMFRNARKRIG